MVAAVARWVYNESYVTMQMRHDIRRTVDGLGLGDEIAYGWQTGCRRMQRWNRVATRVASVPELPPVGSLDEFIVEHYWAYACGRDGLTWEYRVAHWPWRVVRAEDVVWDCDVAAMYAQCTAGAAI